MSRESEILFEILERESKENMKNKIERNFLKSLIFYKLKGYTLSEYLEKRKIEKISIYGYGELGEVIVEIFKKENSIKIENIFDKNICETGLFKNIEKIVDKKIFVLATPIFYKREILSFLKEKKIENIIFIDEVINEKIDVFY